MNPDKASGPYTTITVSDYAHMQEVVLALRKKMQTAREFLEKGLTEAALSLLRKE